MDHEAPCSPCSPPAWCWLSLLGALAHRARLSPLVGYLLAGVMVGPFTPGYAADPDWPRSWARSAWCC